MLGVLQQFARCNSEAWRDTLMEIRGEETKLGEVCSKTPLVGVILEIVHMYHMEKFENDSNRKTSKFENFECEILNEN